jgi:hypothetical protein
MQLDLILGRYRFTRRTMGSRTERRYRQDANTAECHGWDSSVENSLYKRFGFHVFASSACLSGSFILLFGLSWKAISL